MGFIEKLLYGTDRAPARPAAWPPEREQDWIMGDGEGSRMIDFELQSCRGQALAWTRRSTGEVRVPEETIKWYGPGRPFQAAGRWYMSPKQLAQRRKGDSDWYLDCYGRKVLTRTERFPCFDSSDALHEHRCHRWYFLCEDGALTRVYAADGGQKGVMVTEDVRYLESDSWEEMERIGYLERR